MASATKELPALPDASAADEAPKPPAGVFRRLTSKLRSPSQSWVHVSPPAGTLAAGSALEGVPEEPTSQTSTKREIPKRKLSTRKHAMTGGLAYRKGGVDLENAFTSPDQRQAALRAAGLVPSNAKPGRDTHGYMLPLSEQERVLDRAYAVVPEDGPRTSEEGESEAQRIKEAWLKKNSEAMEQSSTPLRDKSRSPDRTMSRRRDGEAEREQERERGKGSERVKEREPEREQQPARTASPQPEPQRVLTSEQIRARRGNDPVFAPQGLMEAMQAYRPHNYRPPPGRKPTTLPVTTQRVPVESASDTDSDDSI